MKSCAFSVPNCTQTRVKIRKIGAKFNLSPYVNYFSPSTNFHKTRKCLISLGADPLHQISSKSVKKHGNYRSTLIYTLMRNMAVNAPIFAGLMSASQIVAKQLPNQLISQTLQPPIQGHGRADGRTDVVHIRRSNSLQVNIPVLLSWSHKTHATLCRQNVSFTRAELCCACSSH